MDPRLSLARENDASAAFAVGFVCALVHRRIVCQTDHDPAIMLWKRAVAQELTCN